jgi:hypothetical protein
MASFCVEKFGIERLTELTHLQIRQRVAKFVDLVNFDAQL